MIRLILVLCSMGSVSAGLWGPVLGSSNLFELSKSTQQGTFFWMAVLFIALASLSFVAILLRRLLSMVSFAFSGATLWVIGYYFYKEWPEKGSQLFGTSTASSLHRSLASPENLTLGWGAFAILGGFVLLILVAPFLRKSR